MPSLAVPGNHDVYAWWHRPFLRIFDPLRRYREFISGDLTPTFEQDNVAVLGINSAYGLTVKGGHIGAAQRTAIQTFFADKPPEVFKVLVVHHHLTKLRSLGRKHDVALNAQKALDMAAAARVDLLLCGHLHVSHIEPLEIIPGAHRMVIASAGTATSSRGRDSNRYTNFYNIIHIEPDHFTIEERRYLPEPRHFSSDCTTRFAR